MAGYVIYSLDWEKFKQLIERPTPAQLSALSAIAADEIEANADEIDEEDSFLQALGREKNRTKVIAERLAQTDWYGDLSFTGKGIWESLIFNACMNCDEIDVGFECESDGVYWDVIELVWKRLKVVPGAISQVAMSTFGSRPYRYVPSGSAQLSREEYDQTQQQNKESLNAMTQLLNQFSKEVKTGKKAPEDLLDELNNFPGITSDHKNALKDLLNDDDESAEEDDLDEEWTSMHSMHTPEEVQKMLGELRSIESAMKKAKNADVRKQFEEDLLPTIEKIAQERRLLFIQVDT